MTRMEETIQFWSGHAVSTSSEVTTLLAKLADAQVAIARLEAENAALKAEQAPIDPTVELRLEIEAKGEENERLLRRLDEVTADWDSMSRRLMALTMENNQLRNGEPVPAAEAEQPAPPAPKSRLNKREREGKPPIVKHCRKCNAEFEVSFRNRLYCSIDCAPLAANGGPRRKVVA